MLEAEDGSVLAIGCNEMGKVYVLPMDMFQKRLSGNRYDMVEAQTYAGDMTIRLYQEKLFSLDNGVCQMLLINSVLIVVGIVFSAVLSWIISNRRLREVMQLERIARGDFSNRFAKGNVFSQLQDIIVAGLSEAKEHEKRALESAAQLRDKNSYMIFNGLISDPEHIQRIFQELGFQSCPAVFFVGVISTSVRLTEENFPPMLRDCLRVQLLHESLELVVFLYGLSTNDGNRVSRKMLARELRNHLHQHNVSKVRIGMSRVYTDPQLIDCAYSEAISVLEHVVSGKIPDFCGCWENVVHDIYFLLPDVSGLKRFSEALQQKDLNGARKWFRYMLDSCQMKECTTKNREYIRYAIMQCLIEHLNSENTVENTVMLKECLNTDIGDEKEFVQAVMDIMKRCLVKKEEDHFTRMIEYIEKNYCRSDLTYEEVAAVGEVNKTYVSKIFRTKLGMSYIEYLTSVRMERAATLLRTTDYNINDIVKMVGYVDSSGFRRSFKDKFGINAADYRKSERDMRGE